MTLEQVVLIMINDKMLDNGQIPKNCTAVSRKTL